MASDTVNTTDWLYGHITLRCDETVDYSNGPQPEDVAVKVMMSVLFVAAIGAVLLMPRRREDGSLPSDGPTETARLAPGVAPSYGKATDSGAKRERWYMLDLARIACVFGVVSEHSGGTTYSWHNAAFGSEWVLQWLFIISGISFMMSRSNFCKYLMRYSLVFAFGVLCNVIGDSIARPGWYNDIGNTIYQMFYVAFIVLISIGAWPLRIAMRGEDDPFGGGHTCGLSDRTLCLVLYNGCFLVSWALYVTGASLDWLVQDLEGGISWSGYLVDFVHNLFYIMARIFIIPALISLHIYLRRTPASAGVLAWIIVALIYIPSIIVPMIMAYGPQCLLLYLLGFYAQRHEYYGASTIRKTTRAYFLFWLAIVLLLSMPDLVGRCDKFPPETIWERFRWYIVECFLAVVLVTRTIEASDPYDMLDAVGWWALWAFCAHVMLARTLPEPYGAVTTYLTAIPIVLLIKLVLPALGLIKSKEREVVVEGGATPILAAADPTPGAPSYGSFGGLFRGSRSQPAALAAP